MNINFNINSGQVGKALDDLRKFSQRPRRAVNSVLFTVDRLIRDSFQNQRSPYGKRWQRLKPSTIIGRRRRGINRTSILLATGQLFRSIERSQGADGQAFISIGTQDRPATPHQFGVPENNLPARPMLPIRPNGQIQFPKRTLDEVDDLVRKELERL